MAITFEILGEPGRDNAAFARIDSGQAIRRVLFDCGENTVAKLSVADIQAIDVVCLSHFHVDHVAGFDTLIRHNYARPGTPVVVIGPDGSIERVQHRLLGFLWNLVGEMRGEFHVIEVRSDSIQRARLLTAEGFANVHDRQIMPRQQGVFACDEFSLEAEILDHGTSCLAFKLCEPSRMNIDQDTLRAAGLSPGPWMRSLKDARVADSVSIDTPAGPVPAGELRRRLIRASPGDSLAYLTDFILDEPTERRLTDWLAGIGIAIVENNFNDEDSHLAAASRHLTTSDLVRLASAIGPRQLVLIHLSDRYGADGWRAQLAQVRAAVPSASLPAQWNIA